MHRREALVTVGSLALQSLELDQQDHREVSREARRLVKICVRHCANC